jgi:hypothetical protein
MCYEKQWDKGERDSAGIGDLSGPVGTVNQEICADANLRAQECTKISFAADVL